MFKSFCAFGGFQKDNLSGCVKVKVCALCRAHCINYLRLAEKGGSWQLCSVDLLVLHDFVDARKITMIFKIKIQDWVLDDQ